MTPRQRVLRLLMIAALAALAGAGWWTFHEGERAEAIHPEVAANHQGPIAPAAPVPVATPPQRANQPPMPDPALPLRDAMASLQSRADAGDSLAACRLGVELLRCAQLGGYPEGHDAFMAREEASKAAEGDIEGAHRIALGRQLHAELRDACLGISARMVARTNHYLRQAALAGEPEAMVRYAAGESITAGNNYVNHFKTPEFDVWRREARPVLMRALASGSPEAALLLAEAHVLEGPLLAMLLPRDVVEASASRALARRLFGDDPGLSRLAPAEGRPAPPAPDAEQAAAAEQLAADWHARGFQGRRLALADSTAALLPVHRRVDWEEGFDRWPGEPGSVACGTSRGSTR